MSRPTNWHLERPELSDLQKLENSGWELVEESDLFVVNGVLEKGAKMASDPVAKFATFRLFSNPSLELMAVTMDFFDQGVGYEEWGPDMTDSTLPYSLALKLGSRWVVKPLSGYTHLDIYELDLDNGKKVIAKVTIKIFEDTPEGKPELVAEREFTRDDLNDYRP